MRNPEGHRPDLTFRYPPKDAQGDGALPKKGRPRASATESYTAFLSPADVAIVYEGKRILEEFPQHAIHVVALGRLAKKRLTQGNPLNRYQQANLIVAGMLMETPGDFDTPAKIFDVEPEDIVQMKKDNRPQDQDEYEEELMGINDDPRLLRRLNRLIPIETRDQRVIDLRGQGLSYKEIADRIGDSSANVASVLVRHRKKQGITPKKRQPKPQS